MHRQDFEGEKHNGLHSSQNQRQTTGSKAFGEDPENSQQPAALRVAIQLLAQDLHEHLDVCWPLATQAVQPPIPIITHRSLPLIWTGPHDCPQLPPTPLGALLCPAVQLPAAEDGIANLIPASCTRIGA
mmetsp:Transcript_67538/g.162142  ORF Transcript_67538/g.162142 Transcript_67538/m.162142 type:complete len:129 (+) Transcript_67538:165-551(+)